MATEEHRALVQRHVEFANTGDERLADELFAVDYVGLRLEGPGAGLADEKRVVAALRAAFPDARLEVEEVLSDGDAVAYRWVLRGTHTGPYRSGALGRTVPPSGKPVAVRGATFQRVAGGRFVEGWGMPNMLALLQQIGALPPAE
jgi:predicted ester cyclase